MTYLTEKYRQGIILPLDDEAEKLVRSYQFDSNSMIEAIILDEKNGIFSKIWYSGLFQKINSEIDTLIDEYEEEIIEYEKLNSVIKILRKYKSLNNRLDDFDMFIDDLIRLVEKAIQLKRPICFVF